MRRSGWVCLLGLLIVLHMPVGGAQPELDFRLEQDQGVWVFSSPHEGFSGSMQEQEAGEHYAWSLSVPSEWDRVVGEVAVPPGHFDVERPRQVVPMVQELLFTEMRSPGGVDEAQGASRVVNITAGGDGGFVYRVGFPVEEGSGEEGSREAVFSLTRDVTPPGFSVGQVQNVTHNSFYVETETTEPALAVLWVAPADGSRDPVEHRTTRPSPEQRFPVPGLQPETEYGFHVEFRDWAGNTAVSGVHHFTTEARVVGPSPQILSVSPEPDAVLSRSPEAIKATFDPVAGEVQPEGVRLFVNLEEVTTGLEVQEGMFHYAPSEPFDPGHHVVRLELMNTEGGEASERWEFWVEQAEETDGHIVSVFMISLVALVVLLRNRDRTDSG